MWYLVVNNFLFMAINEIIICINISNAITPTPDHNRLKVMYLSANSTDSRGLVSKITFNISGPIRAEKCSTQKAFTIARKYATKEKKKHKKDLNLSGNNVNNKHKK